jgi:hypothetical protein
LSMMGNLVVLLFKYGIFPNSLQFSPVFSHPLKCWPSAPPLSQISFLLYLRVQEKPRPCYFMRHLIVFSAQRSLRCSVSCSGYFYFFFVYLEYGIEI